MQIGDIVVRKSYGKDISFKIIDLIEKEENVTYLLKGINLRILADAPSDDLEIISNENLLENGKIFDRRVNLAIKKVLLNRYKLNDKYRNSLVSKNKNKEYKNKDMIFGRPGKILHIDADPEYLKACVKLYKQLSMDVVGKVILEKDQSSMAIELVKSIRPDIVVITGHDGMLKGTKDFLDLKNYKNSKYFVDTVGEIRSYEPDYDDLVIYAGACQSCYEAILDAGANFASSPGRIFIHCLDPVFVCEKIAYTNFENIVSIQEVIENTITGTKGVGGLQTRGKYREGFPKSAYI